MNPTKDEFLLWQDNPITRWVVQAVKAHSQMQKDAWLSASWSKGECDSLLLTELRTRSDAYAALHETTYEGWCELHGVDPRTE